MTTSAEKNTATLIHLSTLTQYFIPFGNYIFPILLWSSRKKDSEYIDYHGKQALNFQLSMLIYSLITIFFAAIGIIYFIIKNIPFDTVFNENSFIVRNFSDGHVSSLIVFATVAFVVFAVAKLIEFVIIIYAALKASNGDYYKYPLTIPFLK